MMELHLSSLKYRVLIFLIMGMYMNNLYVAAQVTIGSAEEPLSGALLDLKEHQADNNNVTASKGLMLPRVALKKLTGNIAATLGVEETLSNEEHAGLVVYNISDTQCAAFPSGVYVWNSSSWFRLGGEVPQDKSHTSPLDANGVGYVTDYEGNRYEIKRFSGTLADGSTYDQVWMTQNLRSLKDANGEWINCPDGMSFNPALSDTIAIQTVTEIPAGTVENYINAGIEKEGQTYGDFIKDFGLLYPTSLMTANICPKDWHLPSIAEWKNLIDVMGGINEAWASAKANPNKGEITAATSTYSTISGYTYDWVPSTTEPNGFNVVPAGYIDVQASGNNVKSFGQQAIFSGKVTNNLIPMITWHQNSSAFKYVAFAERASSNFYLSVRCVKD